MSTVTRQPFRNSKGSDRPRGTSNRTPSLEEVRGRAYEIYKSRISKGVSGDELSDWLQAEHETKDLLRGEVLLSGDQE